MKNIYIKITTVLALAFAVSSCENELNQIPFDEFGVENAYVTAADFENAIRGNYLGLTGTSYYGGAFLSVPDVLSDNVTLSEYGRQTKTILHEWRYDANSGYRGLYQNCYTTIYRANLILENIEGFEGDNKNNITGEALALRALAHFDVARTFAKIPTQSADANGSLGVVYRTDTDPLAQLPRISVAESYQMMVDDLEMAKTLINDSNPDARMNKEAVSLILSRVYLYMGRWQDAIDAANEVTTDVAARDNVVDVWTDDSRDGLIFYIENAEDVLNLGLGVEWSQAGQNNLIPEYVASFQLNALYDNGNDIRRDAYIFDGTEAGGNPVNGIKKLLGKGTTFSGKVDIKLFRAAEASLNRAEAHFALGQEGPARAALDEVRTQRYLTPPAGETGTALRDAIRLERRLEFAFESQRFFDLKRWGLPIVRGSEGGNADGTGQPSNALLLDAGNFRFQLPIDLSSIIVNPNLQQNSGY